MEFCARSKRIFFGYLLWIITCIALLLGAVLGLPRLAYHYGWLSDEPSKLTKEQVMTELQGASDPQPAGLELASKALVAKEVDPNKVSQLLKARESSIPGKFSLAVMDYATGEFVYGYQQDEPRTPASVMKIMTSTALMHEIGPQARFQTTVKLDGNRLTLVGDGDPYLASSPQNPAGNPYFVPANLTDLASQTVDMLRAKGVNEVTLSYDTSLFTGPVWHQDWDETDRTWVAPVSALTVDEGLGSPGLDSASPFAAKKFAEALTAAGIKVDGDPTEAKATGEQIAQVSSQRLSEIVNQVLWYSDNYAAEVLLRHLALARGKEPSFAGGAQALQESLTELGVWQAGMRIVDGSGMSKNNRLTATSLVKILQQIARDPKLVEVGAGLPTAAATGTLINRFWTDESKPGRGEIHGKTGSLSRVSSIAGYAIGDDGSFLVYAMIGNDITEDARPWLDDSAAALAACGCAKT